MTTLSRLPGHPPENTLQSFSKREEVELSIRAKAPVFRDPRSAELLHKVERVATRDVLRAQLKRFGLLGTPPPVSAG